MIQFLSTLGALALAVLGLFRKSPAKTETDASKEVDDETAKENKNGRPDPKFFGDRGL